MTENDSTVLSKKFNCVEVSVVLMRTVQCWFMNFDYVYLINDLHLIYFIKVTQKIWSSAQRDYGSRQSFLLTKSTKPFVLMVIKSLKKQQHCM